MLTSRCGNIKKFRKYLINVNLKLRKQQNDNQKTPLYHIKTFAIFAKYGF